MDGEEEIRRKYAELVLEEEQDVVVSLPVKKTTRHEYYLVGRLLMDKQVPELAFRRTLAKVWQPKEGVNIKNLSMNNFLFKFFHVNGFERVWKGSPWNFKSRLLILAQKSADEDPNQVPLNTVPFWVQVFGVPAGYISTYVCEAVGKFIGIFMDADENNFKMS